MADPTSNVNSTMQSRRLAKEQEMKLDQAANAIQGLLHPYLQVWAMSLSIWGDNCIAAANLIDRWSVDHQQ